MYDRYALLQPPPDNYVVEPASIAQVRASRSGAMVLIEDDVGGVAKGLAEIDHRLKLRYSQAGEYWVVYYEHDESCDPLNCGFPDTCRPERAELILTAMECDQRIVNRVQLIDQHGRSGYDLVQEIERQDAAERQQFRFNDEQRDRIERGVHEMRKIAGHAQRIVVPG